MTDPGETLEYRSHYFDDPDALASFERCAKSVFGLDFAKWRSRGLWDDSYHAYSAFVDGECVASLCVYPSDMMVGGKEKTGAQLLTVGTLAEYRKRGIQRELWRMAYDWIRSECDFAFLFTDESAAGFYEKIGLRRLAEFTDVVPCPPAAGVAAPSITKLDIDRDDHFALVERLARERTMVSHRLGFHTPNLLLFMFLYVYGGWTCHLAESDVVIVAEEKDDRVRIHDIVARDMPSFADLENVLVRFGKTRIEFLFCTDRLGVSGTTRRKVDDSVLFVSDRFELEGEFVFPYSIRA